MMRQLPAVLAGMMIVAMLAKGAADTYDSFKLIAETNRAVVAQSKQFTDVANVVSALVEDVNKLRDSKVGIIYDTGKFIVLRLPSEYNNKQIKIKYEE